MADAVTSETLLDGPSDLVMRFRNVSDGSGESAVAKVDASALSTDAHGNAVSSVTIERIWWNTVGMSAELFWNASSNISARKIKIDSEGYSDYKSFGGLINNAGSGVNGDVLLTTTGHSSGDTYDIILSMKKIY
jgi:hypothetical protein|tara:strand:- start:2732 stop:3133 length:402 start_codon:yes stop_codon:yes gene_type:complete